MNIDRKRFSEVLKNVKDREQKSQTDVLHLVHSAVPLDKLTHSPEWNSFLQLIEGMIELEQKKYEGLHKQIVDPNMVNVEKIMLVKQQITASLSRLATLIETRDLPKQILAAAEQAKRNI